MTWKRWHWLSEGLLPLALVGLRVCSLWLWLGFGQRLMSPSYQDVLLPAWLMVTLLLGSMIITRLGLQFAPSLTPVRLLMAGLGLFMLVFVVWVRLYQPQYAFWEVEWLRRWRLSLLFWSGEVPPSYLILPAVFYLWLRGIIDGSRMIAHRHVRAAFSLGALALVFLLLLVWVDNQAPPPHTALLIFFFFATGLIALALSSLKSARSALIDQNPAGSLLLNRYWLGTVLSVIALLLGAGLAVSLFVAPEMVSQFTQVTWSIVSAILLFLIKAISLIIYPLVLLIVAIISPIFRWILTRFGGLAEQESESADGNGGDFPVPNFEASLADASAFWQWSTLTAIIIVVAAIFMLVVRRLKANDDAGVEETREFVYSRQLLVDQLANLEPDWLKRLRGQEVPFAYPFLSLVDEADPRRAIRQIYQNLLQRAQELGQIRTAHQTPHEYGPQLSQALSADDGSVRIITDRYTQARYSNGMPTDQDVAAARQAWESLETQWAASEEPPGAAAE